MASQEGHNPREGPEEQTRSEFECNEENRWLGYRIWFRMHVEGASLLEAWRAVFPNSDASDESAEEQCAQFMGWWEREFPPTFDMSANATGVSAYFLMEDLKQMLEANVWAWDGKLGRNVRTDQPDSSMRLNALGELIKLLEGSESWRRRFLGMDYPQQLNPTPALRTPEAFEEWAQQRDELDAAERKRATRQRRGPNGRR